MKIDRRFAIIIGINDYNIKPLNFCVNDAESVSEVLERKCFFKKEDIYLITSDDQKPTKEIAGQLEKSLEEIQNKINAQEDSVFFYFAGHGKYEEEKSKIQFHELDVEIKAVFDKINILEPKNQFYVIDACESGGKVFSRKSLHGSLIDKFIYNSGGTYFMFASTEEQSAYERKDLKHGMFTNYFLEVIANEKIYDEGILTPTRIQEYIARETQKNSNFEQVPVIESRSVGYYPFAFTLDKIEDSTRIKEEKISADIINNKTEYFPEIPLKKRQEIFQQLKPLLSEYLENFKFDNENYTGSTSEDLSIFSSDTTDLLLKAIVSESLKQNIISVENIFSAERTVVPENTLLTKFSMLNALFKSNEPEYRTDYYISFFDESKILSKSLLLKSNNIQHISAGINFTIYQSLYGIGFAYSSFFLDYDGYSDNNVKGLKTIILAYIVNENFITNVIGDLQYATEDFNKKLDSWNGKRQSEIEKFQKKAKS